MRNFVDGNARVDYVFLVDVSLDDGLYDVMNLANESVSRRRREGKEGNSHGGGHFR